MDNDHCVYVFDVGDGTTGGLWELISSAIEPDELFYAVWVYFYHNEPYYLDTIFENDPSDDDELLEALYTWIDLYYEEHWTHMEVMGRRKTFLLKNCRFDKHTKTLYVLFRLRGQNEPFHPYNR